MAHLFSKTVIEEAIRNIEIPNIESKIATLQDWLNMYNSGTLQKKSEKEFEWLYNESLFGTILWYSSASSETYTREKEPRNESNGQKCDIGLGFFTPELSKTQAIVELKDAATSLDRPQQRAGNLTPVQQAFKYKPLYNSKWVIVSNFFEIRLYTDTYQDFESFTLRDLIDEKNNYENFRVFYTLFHAEKLIKKEGESETERLLAKVRIEEEKISKEFYKEYKTLRLDLMRDIWKNNPDTRNADIIEKAQRIVDRIVFICFCEDRGLLPQNKLKENIIRSKESDFTPWEVLKKFFQGIDKWSEKLGIPDGYNGGLFKANENIDNLKISDSIVEKFINLGRYDFSEDGGQLSVEILGHIFEQSISDIEEIRTQIENQWKVEEEKETEKKISKRKKDGIFYTPAYIVEYIVVNSLGKYLGEHEETLKEKYRLKEDITEKNYRKREIEAYREYQKILQNVKVLDPACGSGAFLVRVFDFLLAENKRVANILYIEWDQIKLGDNEDVYRDILKNNIYGVDLNEESVEITKLSLWLKSAVKWKKLVTLDANIKCGNSLIDDPAVAGDKAFDWNTEFSDIMASGGFDVIVGNPPYVNIANISDENTRKFFQIKYKTVKNKSDLFSIFVEKSNDVLKNKGLLSFIFPNSWLGTDSFSEFRKFLINETNIHTLVKLPSDVFQDATVTTIIIGFKKEFILDNEISLVTFHDNFQDLPYTLSYKRIRSSKWMTFSFSKQTVIKVNTVKLGLISKFSLGIKTSDDERFISDTKISNEYYKMLRWKDILRYSYQDSGKFLWYRPDLMNEKIWAWPRKIEYFLKPKILFQSICWWEIKAAFDKEHFLTNDKIHILHELSTEYNMKYILCIVNSSFMKSWIYATYNKLLEIKINQLLELPIPNISLSEQQPFIEWADTMLMLNRELHEKSENFLINISTKYKIEKVTRKLEKWWELDFAEFMKELKAKISLEEQEELIGYFSKRKSEITEIVKQINTTDEEIDEMVFELYWLTEEEKRVVLESK